MTARLVRNVRITSMVISESGCASLILLFSVTVLIDVLERER
jgi:hypothetical protein